MTELVRHRLDTWLRCPGCDDLIYRPRYARDLSVCPACGRHGRLTAPQRLRQLLDDGAEITVDPGTEAIDPLGFVDTVPYPERWAAARDRTGLSEAVVCARGTINGEPVAVAAMDFGFLGGSLGIRAGDLVCRATETALRAGMPLLLVPASGGARMQEGVFSLMQMARTSGALAELDEAGILTVSLVTDPTFGGVAASFATATDVILAEPAARLGFAGRRVIEQTVRQRLPEDFQTAEFLLAHGLIDDITPRVGLRTAISQLLTAQHAWRPPPARPGAIVTDPDLLRARPAWECVRLARDRDRPTTREYAHYLLEGFQELHGDRIGDDCPAVVGGIGLLAGSAVMLIGHQKGHTTAELVATNFGMAGPSGYRKSARLMRLAAKLGLPVVALVDTPGADPGISAEEQGQAVAIAENLRLMTTLPVPVVTVITGEGGSGGALAFAVADRVLACANATYSVISPEGCAAILWRDAALAPHAAEALCVDARSLLRHGVVDGIVPEPDGGAQRDHLAAADAVRAAVSTALHELASDDPGALVRRRRLRFARFGSLAQA